jgi:hypothetical protein
MQNNPMQPKPSSYQTEYEQWDQMPPPDPMTLLKLIMSPGFLTKHQTEMLQALLRKPGSAAGGPTGAPPAAMPGPPAPPPAAPAPLGKPPK